MTTAKTISWLPEIAAEIDGLSVKHTSYCDIFLNGEQEAGMPAFVNLPIWETKPEGDFRHLLFVPAYSWETLEHVGYIENGSFGTEIETLIQLSSNIQTEDSEAYSKELQIYQDALSNNATSNADNELNNIGNVLPKLINMAGFGYVMEDTRECKDGHIEGPASIAGWTWLADFASPQNEPVYFYNNSAKAVGIPWVTFGVIPPEDITDEEDIREFLELNTNIRSLKLDLPDFGQLG